MQPSFFQPSGIPGPAPTTPPMMPSVGVVSPPFIPLQGISPTQPFPSPVPSMQQAFPSAMLQAGSYPVPASSVGSYPASASFQAVPLQAAMSTALAATTSASQSFVSFIRYFLFCALY